GTGPALYAGGLFTTAGGVAANHIAKWDGSRWSALGSGIGGVGLVEVQALKVFDDGTGPALYAGGLFTTAGGIAANNIAKWNGGQWSPLGTGVNTNVFALTVFDDGTGPALYAGGLFAGYIAKWDARLRLWSGLLSGIQGGRVVDVQALTVFDGGTGPALHLGGDFLRAGGVPVNRIAAFRCRG